MSEAIFNAESICPVDSKLLEELVHGAKASPRKRFRLCLHRSAEDAIQEMVICVAGPTYFKPHKHPAGRSESYHLIKGRMDVVFFDDDGVPSSLIELEEPGGERPFMYRLSAPIFHFVVPVSPVVIYHETLTGPWSPEDAIVSADFAPEEHDIEGIVRFREDVFKQVSSRAAPN